MQLVREVDCTAERYHQDGRHRFIPPPRTCPHCSERGRLEALGYYHRFLSSLIGSRVLRLAIRRFRCLACGGTVSILPSFAQPYRLVQSHTIDRFMRGEAASIDCITWQELLRRYRSRFRSWICALETVIGGALPSRPPWENTEAWWGVLGSVLGRLPAATVRLTRAYQITMFGRYRCHQPRRACPDTS